MKRLLAAVLVVNVCACSKVRFFKVEPKAGQESHATVGSPMVTWSEGIHRRDGVFIKGYRNELIYAGTDQGVLQLGLKEVEVNTSNPHPLLPRRVWETEKAGIGQAMRYDLKQSREIAFQDMAINVKSADGSGIVYTLTKEPSPKDSRSVRE